MNHFSPMDPSSSYFSINWTFLLIILPLIPIFFFHPSRFTTLYQTTMKFLKKQMHPIIASLYTQTSMIPLLSTFLLIFTLNFISLFPYTFTPTSHMTLNLSLSFPCWLTFILFSWTYNPNPMMSHLTPESTPTPLIPLMILIEITSQMIRPLTLSVRLTTNMIAGHLMMTLLSSMMCLLPPLPTLLSFIPLLTLIILESSMALIQAYIFMILLTLYSKEMN